MTLARLLLLAACAAPLAGCISYTEVANPTPVVVQQPATGTVVVQPN